jgi:cation diffusion facilitator family transporter
MSTGGSKAIITALLANLGVAVAKLIGFLMTGASSMLAEAVHSLADTGNQVLLLVGRRLADRPASSAHPFGYGTERYFWSFVVALVLFVLGSVFALSEGFHKLRAPEPIQSPGVALAILVVAILLEGWSFWTAIKEAAPLKGTASWLAFVRHTKHAELPVVLLEDLGALVGLVIALVGVTLTAVTGDGRFDAASTLGIGILLGLIAVLLAVEMKSLLIGESASPAAVERIVGALTNSSDLKRVIHLRTLHLGPEEILVTAKVEFRADLDQAALATAIDAAEARVRQVAPAAKLIYLEPDIYRPAS